MVDVAPVVKRALLQVPARRDVYEAIASAPGTHVRAISRQADMPLGTVQHHVRQLEKHGLVFPFQAGRRRALFVAGEVDVHDAPVIYCCRKAALRHVLACLADGELGVAALAARLGWPPTTASHNLRRLRDFGLLEHVRVGRESIYMVVDRIRVRRVLGLFGEPDSVGFAGLVARAARPTLAVAP